MKTKCFRLHMLTILLTAVMFLALSLNVYAAKSNAITKDGITAQLITDQDSYEKADSVQVTVKVDNHTGKEVMIKTTVNVPDGVTVVSGEAVAEDNLENSESFTAPVILLSAKDLAAAFGTVDTGDGAKLGLWALVCVLAFGVLAGLSAVKKSNKAWIAMLLCVAMIGGMAAPALAADVSGEIELECTVDIEGTEAKISAIVEFTILEETEESTEESTEASTEASTEESTEASTEESTEESTEASTEESTEESTEASTEESTEESTEASTEGATVAPTEESTEGSTEASTGAPTQAPTEASTEAPTEASTEASTEAPTEAPTVEPLVLHVSVGGAAVDGCSEETHYADIAAAQAALRSMDHSDKPVEVIIHAGTYSFSSKVTFGAQDSGSADYPVVYKAAGDGEVYFTGAKTLDVSGFADVTDAEVLARIPEEARAYVQVISLENTGIAQDILNFRTRYENAYAPLSMVYLYLNGERQTISRWPNDGFETVETVLSTGETAGTMACFGYDGSAPDKWVTADQAYITGYLGNDYNIDWVKIDSVDAKENTITVSDKANYGVQVGARWYAANLLEEMDLPGEYFIDVNANRLYYYPAQELSSTDKLELTAYNDAFINLAGAEYIEFEGIHFAHTLADGVVINGSSNITVRNCEMNDIGGDGIEIKGRNNKVEGCTIYETGLFGVNIIGGADPATYTPSNNVISNNHFWNYATQSLMLYKYAISLGRNTSNQVIGDVVEYNIFHGQPGAGAIIFGGLDNQIRYNEMYALSYDCSDAGIIYCGRKYYEAGNVISYNYIHDYGSKYVNNYDVQAIYFDDTQPHQTAIRNIIVANNKDYATGDLMTGAYNTFSENIIVNALIGYRMTDRNTTVSDGAYKTFNSTTAITDAVLAKYPQIMTLKELIDANDKKIQVVHNTLTYNLTVNVGENRVHDSVINADGANVTGNVNAGQDYSVFVDADNHDYRLTTEAMEKYGFPSTMINEANFEMGMIGIQATVETPSEAFDLLYPADGQVDVRTRDLWLKWEEAQFADEYEYVIATDAALTNVVKTGTVYKPIVKVEGLENGKTYYYSVTAKNISKQIGNEWACTKVNSFTTVAVEPLDFAALNEKLAELKAFDVTNNIGENAGQFDSSVSVPYTTILAKAEALLTSATATQDDVDAMAADLADFIETIGCYKNVGTVELLTETRKWTTYDAKSPSILTAVEGGGQYLETTGSNTMMYPTEILENHNIYQFRMTPGRNSGYMVIALRQQDLSKMPFKVSHGYGIVITDSGFELQRYSTAGSAQLAKYPGEGATAAVTMSREAAAGTEYKVEFGAVDAFDANGNPGVRIYFAVNDIVIFDYIDTEDPQFGEGRFTAYAGDNNSTLKLMPITEFEVIVPDYIYYENDFADEADISDKYFNVVKNDAKNNYSIYTNSSGVTRLRMQIGKNATVRSMYADALFDESVDSDEMIIEVRLGQNSSAAKKAAIALQSPYAMSTDANGDVTYSMNTLLTINEDKTWTVGKEGYKVGSGNSGNFAFKLDLTSETYTVWSKADGADVYTQLTYTGEDGTVVSEFSLEPVADGCKPTFVRIWNEDLETNNSECLSFVSNFKVYRGTSIPDGIYYANNYDSLTSTADITWRVDMNVVKGNISANVDSNSGGYRLMGQITKSASDRYLLANAKLDETVKSDNIIVEVKISRKSGNVPVVEIQYPYACSEDSEGNISYSMNTLLTMEADDVMNWTAGLDNVNVSSGRNIQVAFKINLSAGTYTIWQKVNGAYEQIKIAGENETTVETFTLNKLEGEYAPEFISIQAYKASGLGQIYLDNFAVYSGTEFLADPFGTGN